MRAQTKVCVDLTTDHKTESRSETFKAVRDWYKSRNHLGGSKTVCSGRDTSKKQSPIQNCRTF